jgi:hypothetical protein
MNSLMPSDKASMQAVTAMRRAHRDHAAAMRLYGRLRRRFVLLRNPVPTAIRRLVAEWLQRDELVIAVTLYVSAGGRRHACQACARPTSSWHARDLEQMAPAPPGWRALEQLVMWPAPPGTKVRFPDMPL